MIDKNNLNKKLSSNSNMKADLFTGSSVSRDLILKTKGFM